MRSWRHFLRSSGHILILRRAEKSIQYAGRQRRSKRCRPAATTATTTGNHCARRPRVTSQWSRRAQALSTFSHPRAAMRPGSAIGWAAEQTGGGDLRARAPSSGDVRLSGDRGRARRMLDDPGPADLQTSAACRPDGMLAGRRRADTGRGVSRGAVGLGCPGAIRSAGPVADVADRLAAYRRERSRLVTGLLGRDGGAYCAWCGGKRNGRLTIEHIVPRAAGGTDDPANLCLACRPCNQRRGGVDAIAWYLRCRHAGVQPRTRVLSRRLIELGLVGDMAALHLLATGHLKALDGDRGDPGAGVGASSRNSSLTLTAAAISARCCSSSRAWPRACRGRRCGEARSVAIPRDQRKGTRDQERPRGPPAARAHRPRTLPARAVVEG